MMSSIQARGVQLQGALSGAVPPGGTATPVVPPSSAKKKPPPVEHTGTAPKFVVTAGSGPLPLAGKPVARKKPPAPVERPAPQVWSGASFSIRKLLMFALFVTARCDPTSAHPGSTGPARIETADPPAPLHELIEDLCEAAEPGGRGIKFLLGEKHSINGKRPLNLLTLAEVTLGASMCGPVTVYRESGAPAEHEASFEKLLSGPPKEAARLLMHDVVNRADLSDPDLAGGPALFLKAVGKGNVRLKPMYFRNPSRHDMTAFVKDKVAIGSFGLAHAVFKAMGSRLEGPAGRREGGGLFMAPYAHLSPGKFEEIWDGLARVLKEKQPAVLVISSEAWSDTSLAERAAIMVGALFSHLNMLFPIFPEYAPAYRAEYHEHFMSQGSLAVFETSLSGSANVTIVATESLLPALQKFAVRHGLQSYLFCEGLAGCAAPGPESKARPVRDEL